MNRRREQLEKLVERIEEDEFSRKLLDALKDIEDVLEEPNEFDAENLKLPYSSLVEILDDNGAWK